MSFGLASTLDRSLAGGTPMVLVEIVGVGGSVPRGVGAVMLVGVGETFGSIGGGLLEWQAMARARAMLESGERERVVETVLGSESGQCCGGRARLALKLAGPVELERLRVMEAAAPLQDLLLFGAGHVGRAIAQAVEPLPFRLRWIDERADMFPEGAAGIVSDRPCDTVAEAPPDAAYLVLTHSHALDFRICEAVLRRGDFVYLGLIGSKTKRARFESGLRKLGLDPAPIICPIGGAKVRDKRPEVIAALVAAELITTTHQGETT